MLKGILFNTLFFLLLTTAAHAEGEGNTEDFGKEKPKNGFSLDRNNKELNSFSLRSTMMFKGENVINNLSSNYINFNTSITFQKGQNSYLLPYKKKVMLNKVTFNPNESLRNFSR